MTPHGKNESIARAGIKSKQEWHDTARQKRQHRTRWHRKQGLHRKQHQPQHRTARASQASWHYLQTHAAAGYGRGPCMPWDGIFHVRSAARHNVI